VAFFFALGLSVLRRLRLQAVPSGLEAALNKKKQKKSSSLSSTLECKDKERTIRVIRAEEGGGMLTD